MNDENGIRFVLTPNNNPNTYVSVREQLKELTKQFDKSENDLKALQSVGQIVGEVLKQLTEDKCKELSLIVCRNRYFQ